MDFPHMQDNAFPNLETVAPYSTQNEFSYNRWSDNVKLSVLSVPWDSAYTDTVYFSSASTRDKWLTNNTKHTYEFSSAFHLAPDNTIKLPIPQQVLVRSNYLVVDLPTPTSDNKPLDYASNSSFRYCYFIEQAEYASPSTTIARLKLDVWTTFIYLTSLDYLNVERGHYALSKTSADNYLSNPLKNSGLLLAPDDNFYTGNGITTHTDSVIFNSDVWAVIVTSASFSEDFGIKDTSTYKMPSGANANFSFGFSQYYYYILPTSELDNLLRTIHTLVPQAAQAIKCVLFAPKRLLNVGTEFDFFGISLNFLGTYKTNKDTLLTITKDKFSYGSNYSDYAKLYTFPYAWVEVSDGNGGSSVIKIEETKGTLELEEQLNFAYPALNINAHLKGIGSANNQTLHFVNVTSHSFAIGGNFLEYLFSWNIPTIGIIQSQADYYDYSQYWNNEQSEYSYTQAYTNALASNATSKANTDNMANLSVTNNAVTVAASTSATSTTNLGNAEGQSLQNEKMYADREADLDYNQAAYAAEIESLTLTQANNQAAGITNLVSSIGSAAVSIGSGAASGGPIGAAVGAIGGISTVASAAVSLSNQSAADALAITNQETLYRAANNQTSAKITSATTYGRDMLSMSNGLARDLNTINSNAATTVTANSAEATKTNAQNYKTTADANAQRSRDVSAQAITNARNQAALGAPVEFGVTGGTQSAITRPIAFYASIKTQPKGAIERVAFEFAKYGYRLGQQVKFTTFNLMKNFTYWQCSDVNFTSGVNLIESAKQELQSILEQGVTVWSDPAKIGKVGIYDN